jgi:hypothetical protein
MNRFLDARTPLVFADAAEAGPDDAVLREGAGVAAPGRDWFEADPETAHGVGCVCCVSRNGAGIALARLLLARGRGHGPFFRRVVVAARTEAGRAAVASALESDPLASACFRRDEKGKAKGSAPRTPLGP